MSTVQGPWALAYFYLMQLSWPQKIKERRKENHSDQPQPTKVEKATRCTCKFVHEYYCKESECSILDHKNTRKQMFSFPLFQKGINLKRITEQSNREFYKQKLVGNFDWQYAHSTADHLVRAPSQHLFNILLYFIYMIPRFLLSHKLRTLLVVLD